MRILRVRHHKDATEILWQRERKDGKVDTVCVTSYDQPEPAFMSALKALKPHILNMLAMDGAYGKTLKITTINFSYKNEVMGAVVSCQKGFTDGSKLCFNTPYKPEDAQGGSPVLGEALVTALNQLMLQAENYARGRKSQLELPLDVNDIDANVEQDQMIVKANLAKDMIEETGRVSMAMLQRRLKVKSDKAEKIMDLLHEWKIVGPPKENGEARDVLIETGSKTPVPKLKMNKGGKKDKVAATA